MDDAFFCSILDYDDDDIHDDVNVNVDDNLLIFMY